MAHQLDINTSPDGTPVTSYVGAREDAWHQLGTTLDHAFTAQEAMQHGHLGGWNVRKAPLYFDGEDGQPVQVPNRAATVRTNPVNGRTDYLGTVGSNYQVVQNEQHADLLNALVDESGAHFETAGALHGGRQVFLTMKLPGHMRIGGVDPLETYIAAFNSHDGSMAFTLMTTLVRVVCKNTMNVAFQEASNVYRVRHTTNVERLLRQQARQALDLTFDYTDAFNVEAEKLVQTQMTLSQFEAIIEAEYGVPDDASNARQRHADEKLEQMASLFAHSETHADVRDTAWAGFNALVEWYDHFAPSRTQDRAQKAVLDPKFKQRALALMQGV